MDFLSSESSGLEQAVAAIRMERNPEVRVVMRERCLEALRRAIPDFSDPAFETAVADFNARNAGVLRGLEFSLVRAQDDRLLIIDSHGLLDVGHVEPGKAKDVLRKVKAVELELEGPPNSYALRKELLRLSNGEMRSFEAYTSNLGYPTGAELREYLDVPEHWIPERRRLHEMAIEEEIDAAMDLSQKMEEKYGRKGTVVAMRGNTAAGKSTVMRQMGLPERGVINTDNYKYRLRSAEKTADGLQSVTNNQVHDEGAMLARKIRQGIERVDGVSMVLDSRMQNKSDIDIILARAERKDRVVRFVDIDAPLVVSLVRVLGRKAGGVDPLVAYEGVVDGFVGVRRNRTHLIRRAAKEPRVQSYDLYGFGLGGELELIAQKVPDQEGGFEVRNGLLFPAVVLPSRVALEIATLADVKIDDAFIRAVIPMLKPRDQDRFRQILGRWKDHGNGNMSLAEAVGEHSRRLNETSDASSST